MEIKVIEKNQVLELNIESKQEGQKTFYFGAGWDNPNGPVDLDIVCALLVGGKLTKEDDLVYFGRRTAPGVQLSEDNTTGDGDGDDEDIVINVDELPEECTSVVVGLAAYAGADLNTAPNAHFRVCDGSEESAPQMGDVKVDAAEAGDTVLVSFEIVRSGDNWNLKNIGEFHKCGNGVGAIQGFGKLF